MVAVEQFPGGDRAKRSILVIPWSAYHAGSAAAGARPDPLRAIGRAAPAGRYSAKQSPPIPVIAGSTTHKVATAASAASTALPPAFNTDRPTSEASGWEVAITACSA